MKYLLCSNQDSNTAKEDKSIQDNNSSELSSLNNTSCNEKLKKDDQPSISNVSDIKSEKDETTKKNSSPKNGSNEISLEMLEYYWSTDLIDDIEESKKNKKYIKQLYFNRYKHHRWYELSKIIRDVHRLKKSNNNKKILRQLIFLLFNKINANHLVKQFDENEYFEIYLVNNIDEPYKLQFSPNILYYLPVYHPSNSEKLNRRDFILLKTIYQSLYNPIIKDYSKFYNLIIEIFNDFYEIDELKFKYEKLAKLIEEEDFEAVGDLHYKIIEVFSKKISTLRNEKRVDLLYNSTFNSLLDACDPILLRYFISKQFDSKPLWYLIELFKNYKENKNDDDFILLKNGYKFLISKLYSLIQLKYLRDQKKEFYLIELLLRELIDDSVNHLMLD
ncbi:hypothetical protein HERIO_2400 [Hepatospora eriocheir]|uniref:Uncharacterized protein n=1 Tax=Hepatospora eriocheir TaxID=1081669 RepID=A0A1X0Q725_9MICR|nr:hypothetical protein HERIO_2400 [Hepatospora eriocheir]